MLCNIDYISAYIRSLHIMIYHSIFENRDCEKVIDIWFHDIGENLGSTARPLLRARNASLPASFRRRFRHGSAPPCRGRCERCDRCRSLRILGKPWRADGPGSIEAESHLTGVSRNGNGIMSTGRYHKKYLKII